MFNLIDTVFLKCKVYTSGFKVSKMLYFIVYFFKKHHRKSFHGKGLLLFMLHLIKFLLPSSKFPPEIKYLTFMGALKENASLSFWV